MIEEHQLSPYSLKPSVICWLCRIYVSSADCSSHYIVPQLCHSKHPNQMSTQYNKQTLTTTCTVHNTMQINTQINKHMYSCYWNE